MYTESLEGIYVERKLRVPTFTMSYEHFHTYLEIFYLKSGSCIYSSHERMYPLSAGEIFIVPPGESHHTRYEGLVPCDRFILCFHPERLPASYWEAYPELVSSLASPGKVVLAPEARPVLEALLESIQKENKRPDRYTGELVRLHVMEFLILLQRKGVFVYEHLRQSESISTDIDAALQLIAGSYALPLTLEEVAEQVGLTPTYLSRKFKKVTGVTFKEYLNYVRIRQACQMLLITDDSITRIATSCGFNSSNYFKDCFRRINGVSPRAFRKQAQGHSFEFDARPAMPT